nr:MAG TPA: hemolysin [Caudoviricetes sp.]
MNDAELEHRLTEVEQRSKSNTKRLDKLEQIQNELKAISVTLLKVGDKVEYLGNSVDTLNKKVAETEEQPKKTLGTIKAAIITAICSGLISIIISIIFAVAK